MSPLDLAQNFVSKGTPEERVLGVAMVARSLSDDDPATLRAGWPLDANTVRAAARYLGLGSVSEDFVGEVLMRAPTVSDALLNKGASSGARR